MLTRPLTQSDDRGRGQVTVTPPPALPMAEEGDDDDDECQTGVFSPPVPPWSSSSSSPSSPPPCASSSSHAPSPKLPPSFLSSPTTSPPQYFLAPSSSVPPPPPPVAPSPLSLPLSTRPPLLPPGVFFTPYAPPTSSLFSPLSFSSPFVLPSFLPPTRHHSPAPPSVSSPAPSLPSSSSSARPPPLAPCPHPPPVQLASSSCPPISIITVPSSVCPPSSSRFPPPDPPSVCPSSPSFLSLHPVCSPPAPTALSLRPPPSPSVSSSPSPPPPHNSPPFSSAPAPLHPLLCHFSSVSPPPPPDFFTSCTPHASSSSPLSPPSPRVCPSLLSPSLLSPAPLSVSSSPSSPPPNDSPPLSPPSPPVPPSLLSHPPAAASPLPPAPTLPSAPPPPCCPCSSLLPRLLSAHRLEVRRLLRGALVSIGRRLDSLERRSRRKMLKKRSRQRVEEEEGATCSPGLTVLRFSSASSCSPAPCPPGTSFSSSSSSSDSEDTPPPSSSKSQTEQRRRSRGEEEEGRVRKRRKKHRGRESKEEGEDAGRFVGRMMVSLRRGGDEKEKEVPLILHNFNHRHHRIRGDGGTSQSEKAVNVVRRNGFSGQIFSQSEALIASSGQWRFSDLASPLSHSSNHSAFHLWLSSSSCSISPAPMLRLSAIAVETMADSVRAGACSSPLRPLKDWTAPPSLSSDHCYVRLPTLSPFSARRQQKQRANHSSRSLHLPRRRALPLPPCSANGLPASLPSSQSAAGSEFLGTNGERVKRVSQIRIRRASPRETLLTPMGLPKVKRLKKKEFSLEEIYTNKNYKSPSTNRSLETIFEEPREKDGALLLIGQQRRRRLLLFPDFTQPRKRKRPQGAGLPVATVPRKRAAARRHCHGGGCDDESDLDVMLVERLSALEDFLTRQGLDV